MSVGIADHRVTKGSPPCNSNTKTSALTRMMTAVTTERCRAGGEHSQQHSQHGVQSTNARPRRRPPNRLFEACASDLRAERDSGRSHGSGSKGLEDYIERAMVRARRASKFQPNSDAV